VCLEIRAANKNDVAELHRLRSQEANAQNLLSTPYLSLDEMAYHIDTKSQREFTLVAEWTEGDEASLVGTISLTVGEGREARSGKVHGMMVDQNFHSRGVGTKLLEAILDLSDNWLALVRLELDVLSDNEPAIGLYEKMGFVKEGLRKYASIKDGQFAHEYFMARYRLEALDPEKVD
jgi:putative acetyltransferase